MPDLLAWRPSPQALADFIDRKPHLLLRLLKGFLRQADAGAPRRPPRRTRAKRPGSVAPTNPSAVP
jgi:hypothetical protein